MMERIGEFNLTKCTVGTSTIWSDQSGYIRRIRYMILSVGCSWDSNSNKQLMGEATIASLPIKVE